MNLRKLLVATPLVSLVTLSGAYAFAQTISASSQIYPERIVDGQDLGVSTRPPELNPYGVNGSDCTSDMILRFTVVLAGFDGGESVTLWASIGSDCTSITDRGGAGAVAASCWLVGQGLASPIVSSPTSYTFDVRVQDLVGSQANPPFPAVYRQQDASACTQQPGYAVVPINLNFVVTDETNGPAGTSYMLPPITTDLVGPPAPTGLALGPDGQDAVATWNANADTDTHGYALFDSLLPSPDAGAAGACSPTMDLAQATEADGGSIPGVTTWGVASTRFDLGPMADPTQVGAVLYAVDGSGNVSLPSTQVCQAVTPGAAGAGDSASATSATTGNGCACSTSLAGQGGAPASALLVVLGTALARRRRRTGGGNA